MADDDMAARPPVIEDDQTPPIVPAGPRRTPVNTPKTPNIRQPATDFADPCHHTPDQGLGKVGSLGWAGDQVYGSSGAWGHGSGGGGDGGRGAVEESDEADGEVAQGGRDQRVRWRCAAGGGPRP